MAPVASEPLEVTLDRLRLGLANLLVETDPTLVSRHVFEALERAHDDLTTAISEHRRRPVNPDLEPAPSRAILAARRVLADRRPIEEDLVDYRFPGGIRP